jgi:DNA-binding HxlR family transcriptional regulator
MTEGSARQFGPVATAAEILCNRWTMLLLRELVAGSTRFNDLRRGMPRMSPSLLSKRLKDLEQAGVVERRPVAEEQTLFEYHLTATGREVQPVVEAMGRFGQRWIMAEPSLRGGDPGLLMWDMWRRFDPTVALDRRTVIAFLYPELSGTRRSWWLIIEANETVDLCAIDPGYDVDLHVVAEVRTLRAIWMGLASVRPARERGQLQLTGDRRLATRLAAWLEQRG